MASPSRSIIVCCAFLATGCLLLAGCGVSAMSTNMQGKQMFEQGQYAQAIDMFQKSISADPRNADAYYNMAATYFYLGKQQKNAAWIQQADQLYRQTLSLDPNHVDAYRGLSTLLADAGRSQDAIQMVQNWRVQQPNSAEPIIELARLYRESGDSVTATQLLADAITLDGNNARALRAMGMLREESGEYAQALQNYIRSYQLNNAQGDLPQKIASLEGQARTAQAVIPQNQPGQVYPGAVNQYVPR